MSRVHSAACKLMGAAFFFGGCYMRDQFMVMAAIYLSVSADEWV
jgi:hypothetical protein